MQLQDMLTAHAQFVIHLHWTYDIVTPTAHTTVSLLVTSKSLSQTDMKCFQVKLHPAAENHFFPVHLVTDLLLGANSPLYTW